MSFRQPAIVREIKTRKTAHVRKSVEISSFPPLKFLGSGGGCVCVWKFATTLLKRELKNR